VAARGARYAGPGPAEVHVISDPSVPAGRYAWRQGRPAQPGSFSGFPPPDDLSQLVPPPPAPGPGAAQFAYAAGFPHAHDGRTCTGAVPPGAVTTGLPTVAEPVSPPVPLLTLVTGDRVTQTRRSGACAGRGAVELVLPQVPTVSREHARFTYADGQWWIANLGRNGLTLNGVPLEAGQVLSDGDVIGWGRSPDAPVSRVRIG
jgi:hypothetical protein